MMPSAWPRSAPPAAVKASASGGANLNQRTLLSVVSTIEDRAHSSCKHRFYPPIVLATSRATMTND